MTTGNINHITRRRFLVGTAAAGALWALPHSRAFGANDRIRVGVIGCGAQGTENIGWANKSGAEVVAVCDPDKSQMDKACNGKPDKSQMDKTPKNLKQYQNIRKLLDDDSIDAVVIATPNHWHALATIWACQAGKDVYVQKPACHSIWEGRKMVEAARKYKRIVQVGTQHRSDPAYLELRELIAKKELGEIQWIHSLWYANRAPIGKTTEPTAIPDYIDYDEWCGPREKVPLMRKNLHYDWHWFWDYGNGDMGNRVIHVIDDIHHVLQMNSDVPTKMMAVGKRFQYNDDSNTPNTEFIVMNWKVPIIFGSQNLPNSKQSGGDSVYRRFGKGFRFTNLIKCENGFFAVSRGGGTVCDNNGATIRQIKGDGGGGHMRNFLDAVRSRKSGDLNADIEQGHLGCLMLHTGNISYRIGKEAGVDEVGKQVGGFEESKETWNQTMDHLKANDIDLNVDKPILGPWLTFDPKKERFTGAHAEAANALVKETYRHPYSIPKKV